VNIGDIKNNISDMDIQWCNRLRAQRKERLVVGTPTTFHGHTFRARCGERPGGLQFHHQNRRLY
jgi:hypothetical protein